MPLYADTDFLLALFKPGDPFYRSAAGILRRHRGDIVVSEASLIELMLMAVRYGLDPLMLMTSLLGIVRPKNLSHTLALTAASYISLRGVTPFDAFHAAHAQAQHMRIISSDSVFDRLGLQRRRLVRR